MSAPVPGPQLSCRDEAAVEAAAAACGEAAGRGELLVLLDFDRTVTANFMPDGTRVTSAHGVLESANVLSETFRAEAKELFNKYYPIEIDANMPVAEKIPIMNEWYEQVHEKILHETVTRENIASAVRSCSTSVRLRDGFAELVRSCQKSEPPVPVLIMSAGLGDVIDELLQQSLPFPLAPTTRVVSNRMIFDESGKLTGFSEPLLHMFNKSAAFLPADVRTLVAGKKRCLLCGDGVGDATMADGLDVEVLKVGFLNEKIDERLEEFRRTFDAVVLNDGAVPAICLRAVGADAIAN